MSGRTGTTHGGIPVSEHADPATEEHAARETALRVLSARDHTRASLAARLARRGLGPEARARAVEALTRAGYVDDGRFARGRALALAGRGAGDAMIREDLTRQGVDAPESEEAIAGLEPEHVRAARIADARGRTPRTWRFLAAKGFREESLEALVADGDEGAIR